MLMPASIPSSSISTRSFDSPFGDSIVVAEDTLSIQTAPDSKGVGSIDLLLNSGPSVASFALTTMALDANNRVKMGGDWGQVWKSGIQAFSGYMVLT